MGGEIFSTAVLVFGMILVGLSVGFLMLKVQGGEEQSLLSVSLTARSQVGLGRSVSFLPFGRKDIAL